MKDKTCPECGAHLEPSDQNCDERQENVRPLSPQERTRKSVYATENRWAIENYNATH